MTAWPGLGRPNPALVGSEGELVSIRISIEARLLERLLDTLAQLDFPINPEIRFASGPVTVVEFPAWSGRVAGVRDVVAAAGFDPVVVSVRSMLDEIRTDPPRPFPASA